MSLVFGLAVYFIIWWTVLFAILPFGNVSQDEDGDVVPGTPEGAPVAPRMLRKALITTLISALIFGVFWIGYEQEWIKLDGLPIADQVNPPVTRN